MELADWLGIAVSVLSVCLGAVGWFLKHQFARIDVLESKAIDREEYNRTLEALRRQMAENAKATTERLDAILLYLAKRGPSD